MTGCVHDESRPYPVVVNVAAAHWRLSPSVRTWPSRWFIPSWYRIPSKTTRRGIDATNRRRRRNDFGKRAT